MTEGDIPKSWLNMASALSHPRSREERKMRKEWREDEEYIAETSQSITEVILGQIGTREALLAEYTPPVDRNSFREGRVVEGLGAMVELKMKQLGFEVKFDQAATNKISLEEFEMKDMPGATGFRLTNPASIVFQNTSSELPPPEYEPGDWLR